MSLNLLETRSTTLLNLVDWQEVIGVLGQKMYFLNSKKNIENCPFFCSKDELLANFESMDSYLENKNEYDQIINEELGHIKSDTDFSVLLKKLTRGHILDLGELNVLANIFFSYKKLNKSIRIFCKNNDNPVDYPTLSLIETKFIRPIRTFVERNGEIHFDQHPLFFEIYKKILQIETQIREELSNLVKQNPYKDAIQYSEYDIVNDRYVIAVRSDSYKSPLGQIMARSNSGMTLFVEPISLREKSQLRIQYLAELDEIKNKICQEFSLFLHGYDKEFVTFKDYLIIMDSLKAKCSYSYEYDLVRPTLCDDFQINIKNFWHPLLKNPVKNSIHLLPEQKGLIISGPNTGGKTVALKSIAISYMFLYSGLFLPAHEAMIYPISELYYLGSDGQDLSDGLSSFSAEAKNYLLLLKNIKSDSLILIDEIFNSTSSEEASALAISLLYKLQENVNTKVIISTHHQLLKTYMHDNQDYLSAHVEYDHEKNQPTYKLMVGQPGSSLAFKIFSQIAQSCEIDEDITVKAFEVYDKKQHLYEKLLDELSHKKSAYQKLLLEQTGLNHELKNQKQSMEGLLFIERKTMLESYQKKLEKLLNEARDLIKNIKEDKAKDQKKIFETISHLRSNLNQEKEQVISYSSEEQKYIDKPLQIKDIVLNAQYFSTSLHKTVTVVYINERKNEVCGMVLKVSVILKVEDLRLLKNQPHLNKSKNQIEIIIQNDDDKPMEIDCRGMRLSEFETIVEQSLSGLYQGDIPFVNIIHGHGDGILKNWLRQRVESDRALMWETSEGNDGHTEIKLR